MIQRTNPKQAPAPFNTPAVSPPESDRGFQNFTHNTDFLHKVNNPHFPHRGAGTHIPVWLTPALANEVLTRHGHTGHAIPHPDIDLGDLTK